MAALKDPPPPETEPDPESEVEKEGGARPEVEEPNDKSKLLELDGNTRADELIDGAALLESSSSSSPSGHPEPKQTHGLSGSIGVSSQ